MTTKGTIEMTYPQTPARLGPEPLIDPDCRDGKCGSCAGGPCEHDCHAEQAWAEVARASHQALVLLGYPTPDCLPGDAEPCGGGYAEHAAANLAAIKAVADHQMQHLAAPAALEAEVYWRVRGEVEENCDHDYIDAEILLPEPSAAAEHIAADHESLRRTWALIGDWRVAADVADQGGEGSWRMAADVFRRCAAELAEAITGSEVTS